MMSQCDSPLVPVSRHLPHLLLVNLLVLRLDLRLQLEDLDVRGHHDLAEHDCSLVRRRGASAGPQAGPALTINRRGSAPSTLQMTLYAFLAGASVILYARLNAAQLRWCMPVQRSRNGLGDNSSSHGRVSGKPFPQPRERQTNGKNSTETGLGALDRTGNGDVPLQRLSVVQPSPYLIQEKNAEDAIGWTLSWGQIFHFPTESSVFNVILEKRKKSYRAHAEN